MTPVDRGATEARRASHAFTSRGSSPALKPDEESELIMVLPENAILDHCKNTKNNQAVPSPENQKVYMTHGDR